MSNNMDVYDKLTHTWPIIKWLDDARWETGASESLIPGRMFSSLSPSKKVLAHWLSYITDQQRPWQQVWYDGGPIFAELVQQHGRTTSSKDTIDFLCHFTESNGPGRVDTFKSKEQTRNGDLISYTPRYGMHMLSIARSLQTLSAFKNDIVFYLYNNAGFVYRNPVHEDDTPTLRIVFLLYMLSYNKLVKGVTSFHGQKEAFIKDIDEYFNFISCLLESSKKLEDYYISWINNRFHKRLWAAFRDYVKLGSKFAPIFLNALGELRAESYIDLLKDNIRSVLCSLELPGDVWNLAFNDKLFS